MMFIFSRTQTMVSTFTMQTELCMKVSIVSIDLHLAKLIILRRTCRLAYQRF